jgi:predicted transcriptional regulator
MATVSIRIPDDLKERMDEHEDVNWSAVLRERLRQEVDERESEKVAHAVATSERLSAEIDEEEVADTNTAETIREWRKRRR